MMGYDQHVAFHNPLLQHLFRRAFYVAGQQHGSAARLDAQHAALVVAPRRFPAGTRVQEFEAHAVPFPARARAAALRRGHQGIQGVRAQIRAALLLD